MIGRLHEPLLTPTESERRGYVPNVVYTCGALVHGGQLIIPYGFADHATGFATVALDEVLGAMARSSETHRAIRTVDFPFPVLSSYSPSTGGIATWAAPFSFFMSEDTQYGRTMKRHAALLTAAGFLAAPLLAQAQPEPASVARAPGGSLGHRPHKPAGRPAKSGREELENRTFRHHRRADHPVHGGGRHVAAQERRWHTHRQRLYTAYTRDGVTDLSKRPLTFAFNGGPGLLSVWLQMGMLGPRRVAMDPDG